MKNMIALALALCLMLSLCACGGDAAVETQPKETEAPAVETTAAPEVEAPAVPEGMVVYTVTVVDEGGNPVPSAMVQLCKDSCVPGVTNESGVATFTLAEDAYKASMLSMPAGYEYAGETEEFYFENGSFEVTIVLKAVA